MYTECYVNTQGEDYKGRVAQTTDGTACVAWNSPLPIAYGITSDKYPLLDGHNFCRNPDGRGPSPWCFIESAGPPITSDTESYPGQGVHWDYCTISTAKQTTCHTGKVKMFVWC